MFVALEKSVDLGTGTYQVKKAQCKENWLNLSQGRGDWGPHNRLLLLKVAQIHRKFLLLVHRTGFLYAKAIMPVTSACLLTKPFIGRLKVWKIMTPVFLEMLGWGCCLGKWEFYGTVSHLNHLKTSRRVLWRAVKVKKEGVVRGELEGRSTAFCWGAPVPRASPHRCSVSLSTWTVIGCVCPSPTRHLSGIVERQRSTNI